MSDDNSNVVTPEEKTGGKKKSNGHKANCKCPICKNMKMKKGGSMSTLRPANFVGGKKANGHKGTCKCPICVNMKHQKASKKNRRVKRSKRTRRGGTNGDSDDEGNDADDELNISGDYDNNPNPQDDNQDGNQNNVEANGQLFGDDDVVGPADAAAVAGVPDAAKPADDAGKGGKKKRKSNGHKATCKCPICKNMKMKKGGAIDDDSSSSSDSDSDSSSSSDSNSDSSSDSDTTTDAAMGGGKKKRKGNGHKAACKCPICKNMKIKKGGVKSPYPEKDPDNKQKSHYVINKELGGSKRRKTRKSRKTRKIRKRR
jgi:hypothetical protein